MTPVSLDGLQRMVTDRDATNLRSFAEHGDGALREIDVGWGETTQLADAQPCAVEEFEHGTVARVDGQLCAGGWFVAVARRTVLGVLGVVRGLVRGAIEQLVGFVGPRYARKTARAFRCCELLANIRFSDAMTLEVVQEGSDTRGFAGNRRPRKPQRVEVREVTPQDPRRDIVRRASGAATTPRCELTTVEAIGTPRIGTHRGQRRKKRFDAIRV